MWRFPPCDVFMGNLWIVTKIGQNTNIRSFFSKLCLLLTFSYNILDSCFFVLSLSSDVTSQFCSLIFPQVLGRLFLHLRSPSVFLSEEPVGANPWRLFKKQLTLWRNASPHSCSLVQPGTSWPQSQISAVLRWTLEVPHYSFEFTSPPANMTLSLLYDLKNVLYSWDIMSTCLKWEQNSAV